MMIGQFRKASVDMTKGDKRAIDSCLAKIEKRTVMSEKYNRIYNKM